MAAASPLFRLSLRLALGRAQLASLKLSIWLSLAAVGVARNKARQVALVDFALVQDLASQQVLITP